ncbi:MAG: DUF2249 domain-containing protein [Candidatus Lambdaproteobacteria bacterium]|nr:DUF2249 domain-containing protein [Candidatus Lambdaproteobacteria bacterium]
MDPQTGRSAEALDLRALPPPEPMLAIQAALAGMAVGETLEALLARRPVYFLPHLERAGHACTLEQLDPDTWKLTVTKA